MPLNKDQVIAALRTVMDPELSKDIVTLNMVKDVQVDGDNVGVCDERCREAEEERGEQAQGRAAERAWGAKIDPRDTSAEAVQRQAASNFSS